MKKFNAVKRVLLPDTIIEQLKDMIVKGELSLGDRLPPEKELAEQFGVGRTTVREAIKSLCFVGILKRTNEGSYINQEISILDSEMIAFKMLLQDNDKSELYEARKILDSEMAVLATKNITSEGLQLLEDSIENAENNIGDPNIFFQSDMDFHLTIADESGNAVLYELYTIIIDMMYRAYEGKLDFMKDLELQKQGIENHRMILRAIKDGNSKLAREKSGEVLYEHFEALLLAKKNLGKLI